MLKISIIIPTYNNEHTIEKCLASIFNQTFKDYEIIVVNDGSTDKTLEILNNYKDRIKIINQENQGAPRARNRGFEESSGKYVIFADADLIFKPTALEKMSRVLEENNDVAYVYPSFRFGWKKFRCGEFDSEKLKQMPYIHTSALIRRQAFPGFDESLKKFQDWDLWLTILENGGYGKWVDEVLFRIQTKDGGISSWMPKIFYKLPFLSKKIKQHVDQYNQAKEIIFKKHGLDKEIKIV